MWLIDCPALSSPPPVNSCTDDADFLSIRSKSVVSFTRTLGKGALPSSNSCARTGRKPTTSTKKSREIFGLSTHNTTWSMFMMSVYHPPGYVSGPYRRCSHKRSFGRLPPVAFVTAHRQLSGAACRQRFSGSEIQQAAFPGSSHSIDENNVTAKGAKRPRLYGTAYGTLYSGQGAGASAVFRKTAKLPAS